MKKAWVIVSLAILLGICFVLYGKVSVLNFGRTFSAFTHKNESPWNLEQYMHRERFLVEQDVDIISFNKLRCFTEGTDADKMRRTSTHCLCRDNWFGQWCSFPTVFKYSTLSSDRLTLREEARRIIYAIPFNLEFDLLETRFNEIGDLVDYFVISEANYTKLGNPRPLRLQRALSEGFLREWQKKIIYVYVDTKPVQFYTDWWSGEAYVRNISSAHAMKVVQNPRDDDIFLSSDTDELLRRDVVQLLKYHDGYTEPILVAFWVTRYGFFWHINTNSDIVVAVTLRFLREVFEYRAGSIRILTNRYPSPRFQKLVDKYVKSGGTFKRWTIGDKKHYAGWHCSSCLQPEDIQTKYLSTAKVDGQHRYTEKFMSVLKSKKEFKTASKVQ